MISDRQNAWISDPSTLTTVEQHSFPMSGRLDRIFGSAYLYFFGGMSATATMAYLLLTASIFALSALYALAPIDATHAMKMPTHSMGYDAFATAVWLIMTLAIIPLVTYHVTAPEGVLKRVVFVTFVTATVPFIEKVQKHRFGISRDGVSFMKRVIDSNRILWYKYSQGEEEVLIERPVLIK